MARAKKATPSAKAISSNEVNSVAEKLQEKKDKEAIVEENTKAMEEAAETIIKEQEKKVEEEAKEEIKKEILKEASPIIEKAAEEVKKEVEKGLTPRQRKMRAANMKKGKEVVAHKGVSHTYNCNWCGQKYTI